jgi:hypothetical protein
MAAQPLPVPLTVKEGTDLRDRLEQALATAQDAFIAANVRCDDQGTPFGGPDPRAVHAEALFVLARYLARAGLDLVGAAAFEEKLKYMEAEVATRAPKLADGTAPGNEKAPACDPPVPLRKRAP